MKVPSSNSITTIISSTMNWLCANDCRKLTAADGTSRYASSQPNTAAVAITNRITPVLRAAWVTVPRNSRQSSWRYSTVVTSSA